MTTEEPTPTATSSTATSGASSGASSGEAAPQSRSRITPRSILTVLGGLFVLNALAFTYFVLVRLNYVQIDLGGHIGSAAAFREGLYHQFNDQFFLGYVHGLFYPPLEDILITIFGVPFGGDLVLGYKLYLIVLFSSYLAAGWSLSLLAKSPWVRCVFLFVFLFLTNMDKTTLAYQGLGVLDMLVIGLSGQVLAGLFLFLFAKAIAEEAWSSGRMVRVAAFGSLVVLSHMVMGIVAAVLMGFAIVLRRDLKMLLSGLWIIGLTAIFWLPFLDNRSSITSSTIFVNPAPWWWFAVGAAAIVVGALVHRRAQRELSIAWPFIATGTVMVGIQTVGFYLASRLGHAPAMHYYRFVAPGLLCLLIGVMMLASAQWPVKIRGMRLNLAAVPLVFALVVALYSHQLVVPWLDTPYFRASELDASNFDTKLPSYSRHWMHQNPRSCDFGLDSLLSVDDPEFRSAKGLYWESSKSNVILSSYLATLGGLPTVLNYYYFWDFPCSMHACYVESFARTYNLGAITFDPYMVNARTPRPQRACYRKFAAAGRIGALWLRKRGTVSHEPHHYTSYQIDAIPEFRHYLQAVEPIGMAQLRPIALATEDLQATHMIAVQQSCSQRGVISDHVLMDTPVLEALKGEVGDSAPLTPDRKLVTSMTKLGPGTFQVQVPSAAPTLFWIKLNHYQGFVLTDADGKRVPLAPALPGMVGFGNGTMTLQYRAPVTTTLGRLVSGLTLLAALGLVSLAWWRRRSLTSRN